MQRIISPWKSFKKYMRDHGPVFHICAAILWLWALSLLFVLFLGLMITFTEGRQYELYPNRIFPEKSAGITVPSA